MNVVCDIVVLTWNQLDVTKTFLQSFLSCTSIPCRLIIIDNASSDGTVEYLSSLEKEKKYNITLVLNGENKGFVMGVNQGIALSDAPFVCLANNDLVLSQGWMEEIISVFKHNGRVGLLNPNSNNLGTVLPVNSNIEMLAQDLKERYEGVFVEMPFCIGFCMVIRREVIDKIGGFSKEFSPAFFEDSDYSLKVQSVGYLIGMAKASYVWHKEHVSFKALGNKKKEEHFSKSRETFFKKWGKILRVAWIINSFEELKNHLNKGIAIARRGNYVWYFVKNLDKNRTAIFAENNLTEHSGINFIRYKNIADLIWKIIKKKKKYDLIIGQDRFIKMMFSKLGYPVLKDFNENELKTVKYSKL